MEIKELLKMVSWPLALISLTVALFLLGEIIGFKQGYEVSIEAPITEKLSFGVSGPSVFEVIRDRYVLIVFCFFTYCFGRFFGEESISQAFCLPSLMVLVYQYAALLIFKHDLLTNPHYLNWFGFSVPLDWFCFLACVFLLLLHTGVIALKYKLNREIK